MACEAKGPDMNNKFCSSYIHKRGKSPDSDHSADDNEEHFPGYNIRKEAYNRVVENHKDKISQHNEEKEAKKVNNILKLNQLKDNEPQE
eukprot:8070367-Heterocapsa_arctica.AAC.1